MSLLEALQNQSSELDNYENRITNAMSNFDIEDQIYKQSDLAFKQGKQLANQVFSGQQLENLSLAVPAVYGITKGAYTRYKAGKPLLPTRAEIEDSVRNFGRGQFNRGAKATVDTLKGALPDDLVKVYDDKYQGKLPGNLEELQDHVATLKNLATQKVSDTVSSVSEKAQDIGRRATGRVIDSDRVDRVAAQVREQQLAARRAVPEVPEVPSVPEVPTVPGPGGGARDLGAFDSPNERILKAFHNENFRAFEGFSPEVQRTIIDRMDKMNVLNETDEVTGRLNPDKLKIQSNIISEAASQYGLPQSKGFGAGRTSGGFDADLEWRVEGGQGRLVNRNTGEQVRDIGSLGSDDLPPSQQYREISSAEDDRSFDVPNTNLRNILPLDPPAPSGTLERGPPPGVTEFEQRSRIAQEALERDPEAFARSIPPPAPTARPAEPEDISRVDRTGDRIDRIGRGEASFEAPGRDPSRPLASAEDLARPLGAEPTEPVTLAPARNLAADQAFFDDLGAQTEAIRAQRAAAQPPPPPREQLQGTTRTADPESIQQRADIRGPYGTSVDQAGGTAPTTFTAESLPALNQELSARTTAPSAGAAPDAPRPAPVDVKGPDVSAEEAGGALGGAAALGEGIETLSDKELTGGQKAEAIGKEAGTLAAFAAGGTELGGAVATGEILTESGVSAGQKIKQVGKLGATLGGAAAASAVIPGAGELLMGVLAIGGLIKDKIEQKKAESEQVEAAPSAPRMPQVSGIAFDSAPVIDSSNFHQL